MIFLFLVSFNSPHIVVSDGINFFSQFFTDPETLNFFYQNQKKKILSLKEIYFLFECNRNVFGMKSIAFCKIYRLVQKKSDQIKENGSPELPE